MKSIKTPDVALKPNRYESLGQNVGLLEQCLTVVFTKQQTFVLCSQNNLVLFTTYLDYFSQPSFVTLL